MVSAEVKEHVNEIGDNELYDLFDLFHADIKGMAEKIFITNAVMSVE